MGAALAPPRIWAHIGVVRSAKANAAMARLQRIVKFYAPLGFPIVKSFANSVPWHEGAGVLPWRIGVEVTVGP
jgi:hypothetical protein